MGRQQQSFREMQSLSYHAGAYNGHMLAKMEQLREWREDADVSRAAVVARRQMERERAAVRQSVWQRLQVVFRAGRTRTVPSPFEGEGVVEPC